METDTVMRKEYSGKKGERYEIKKPKDSNILRGDGSFVAQTDKGIEYTAKTGERYEVVKQGSSDIWKVCTYTVMFRSCAFHCYPSFPMTIHQNF